MWIIDGEIWRRPWGNTSCKMEPVLKCQIPRLIAAARTTRPFGTLNSLRNRHSLPNAEKAPPAKEEYTEPFAYVRYIISALIYGIRLVAFRISLHARSMSLSRIFNLY